MQGVESVAADVSCCAGAGGILSACFRSKLRVVLTGILSLVPFCLLGVCLLTSVDACRYFKSSC